LGSRKAAFGLHLRAGLAAPNRVWDFSLLLPGSWFTANLRIRTAIESADSQNCSSEMLEGCWHDSN